MEYLGQFSDPVRVAEILKETGSNELKRKKIELVKLELPKAKAMLQMILKGAYVWTDGRVELEFR